MQSITALEIFEGMQAEAERQRASNFFKVQRRRQLAEAKRLHKQEEAETKRQQKDSLKVAPSPRIRHCCLALT